ncbi:uncharacterized protein A1O5_02623 [Cladophialophora psammophila CBS 110553]|uniref:Uncharacterized protein n=1 Tax=Cladophialophora psammophila CBS 110553 TaxID=1182543 RepID=W9X1J9_9EURO|nr:uncharacterized protein A1O5_02623 [Cladophialophora psammophila CBS 110553]EXJ74327.1 hypothetical protein A1O5_02623 [Cladophialophora psammophila CBS 110553]
MYRVVAQWVAQGQVSGKVDVDTTHLAKKPIVLIVIAPTDEQIHPQVFDPVPVFLVERFEEIVEAEIIAQHEESLLSCSLRKWLDFIADLTADSKDAVVTVLIRGGVVAAGV